MINISPMVTCFDPAKGECKVAVMKATSMNGYAASIKIASFVPPAI